MIPRALCIATSTRCGKSNLTSPLQNGLGNLEIIAGLLGKDKAVGGRVIFGAELLEPGRVQNYRLC